MRAEAEAAAAQGGFGLTFIEDSYSKEWAVCEVEYETNKVVPAPVHAPIRRHLTHTSPSAAPRSGFQLQSSTRPSAVPLRVI